LTPDTLLELPSLSEEYRLKLSENTVLKRCGPRRKEVRVESYVIKNCTQCEDSLKIKVVFISGTKSHNTCNLLFYVTSLLVSSFRSTVHTFPDSSSSSFFLYTLERWGVCPIPRLVLLLRITAYSRQVISLALEARYLEQLDSQYLYPLGSPGGPAIPPRTGCLF
jgi:hypothetical protein